jgi:Leucine-rich repeat (LRR) protein
MKKKLFIIMLIVTMGSLLCFQRLWDKGDRMKRSYFLIVLLFTFFQLTWFVHGDIPASERAVLITLYTSTNGDNWTDNNGWKTPPLDIDGFAMPGTEGSWKGVTVSGDHVSHIDLDSNQLSGSIPSQLGNLSKLERLSLTANPLSGGIPSQLGNLSNLLELDLGGNLLSGSIPSQLGNLSKLEKLYLGFNQLSGSIPSELGNLNNLEHLFLFNNQLSGSIPSELGNLSNLEYLLLYDNQLSRSIPSELGNLSNIREIALGFNRLSGSIPSQLGNLSNLTYLRLYSNQLSGSIPSELGNLSNIREISLGYNQLSGSIPSELGNLSHLNSLGLDKNQLSGSIPSELGNLSNLNYLNLHGNKLSGEIPSSFTNLPAISVLDIGNNCLSATDPNLRAWLDSHDPDWEAHQDQCGGNLPEIDPPFGAFDTPLNGSTVAGSIAVTGWALDDGGLESVKIYLIQGNTQTQLGDALFVEGARPDVTDSFPEYPNNTKAGWGYMMLTNFLPEGGNGTYVISATATDLVGKITTLGTKTIFVDNAHAVKPFGAIDTPTQGGIASGGSFTNWGWVLTPQPNSIPIDGSTLSVWVDGVNKGQPEYNIYREDISTLFPGYVNSNGAIGYFNLDTTKYDDGVHTISWIAEDNGGNSDGIGSRYFSIQNSSSDIAGSVSTSAMEINIQEIAAIPGDFSEPLKFNKGFNADNEYQEVLPDENGNNRLIIKELERVEIRLGENYTDIRGFLKRGDELSKLPIGSTLDARCGTFFWSPGPGFLGSYSLVFVLTDSKGQSFKKFIEIIIEPKFNGR